MKWINHIAIMSACLIAIPGAVSAAENVQASSKVMAQGEDVQVILDTLNEALTENNQFREDIKVKEKELKEINREANALRGRLRTFERTQKRAETERDAAEEKLKELRQKQFNLTAELRQKLYETENEAKDLVSEKEKLEAKIEELNTLLADSIMSEEKEEYDRMIHEANEAAENALRQISSVSVAAEKMRTELVDLNFKMGNSAFEKQDYEKAVWHYNKALEYDPENSGAHHNLGIIFDYYLVNNDRAVHHYRRFLNLQPISDQAHFVRERVLELRLGKALIPSEPLDHDFYKRPHYST